MSRATKNFENARATRDFFFTILESAFFLALLKILGDRNGSVFFDLAYGFGFLLTLVYALFAGDRLLEVAIGVTEEEVDSKWKKLGFRTLGTFAATALASFAILGVEAALVVELLKFNTQ